MMLYGYTHSQERALRAGFWIGMGVGIGFMSKGFIAPALFLLIAVMLPALFRNWRTRNYLFSMLIAVLCSLPWLTVWPAMLYQHSPALFADWAWSHNTGKWLNYMKSVPGKDIFYYLKSLPWLAWPALPLARVMLPSFIPVRRRLSRRVMSSSLSVLGCGHWWALC